MNCIRCGVEGYGGTWVNGFGPYCPHCLPPSIQTTGQFVSASDYCLHRLTCPFSSDCPKPSGGVAVLPAGPVMEAKP